MTFMVIEPSGGKQTVLLPPEHVTLVGRIGGVEVVGTDHTVSGIVHPWSYVRTWPVNPVAGVMLILLGGPWRSYAGPVAFVGAEADSEVPAPLDTANVRALARLWQDVCWVLEVQDVTEPGSPALVVPRAEIRKAADYIEARPGV